MNESQAGPSRPRLTGANSSVLPTDSKDWNSRARPGMQRPISNPFHATSGPFQDSRDATEGTSWPNGRLMYSDHSSHDRGQAPPFQRNLEEKGEQRPRPAPAGLDYGDPYERPQRSEVRAAGRLPSQQEARDGHFIYPQNDRPFRGRGHRGFGFPRGRGRGTGDFYQPRRSPTYPRFAENSTTTQSPGRMEEVSVQLGVRADGTPIFSQNRKEYRRPFQSSSGGLGRPQFSQFNRPLNNESSGRAPYYRDMNANLNDNRTLAGATTMEESPYEVKIPSQVEPPEESANNTDELKMQSHPDGSVLETDMFQDDGKPSLSINVPAQLSGNVTDAVEQDEAIATKLEPEEELTGNSISDLTFPVHKAVSSTDVPAQELSAAPSQVIHDTSSSLDVSRQADTDIDHTDLAEKTKADEALKSAELALEHTSAPQANVGELDTEASKPMETDGGSTFSNVLPQSFTDAPPPSVEKYAASQATVMNHTDRSKPEQLSQLHSVFLQYKSATALSKDEDILEENKSVVAAVEAEDQIRFDEDQTAPFDIDAKVSAQERIVQAALLDHLRARQTVMTEKELSLKRTYRDLHKRWLLHSQKLDKMAERRQEILRRAEMAASLPVDSLPTPVEEPTTPGSMLTGRSSRRNPIISDYAATDAQLEEILMLSKIQYETDPKARARKTAATVPGMILDPIERKIAAFDDSSRKIYDPVVYYHINQLQAVDKWSDEEIRTFESLYALYPKQFGKIASLIPGKTSEQCVLRYYRSKKTSKTFMDILSAKAKDGRKKRGPMLKTKAKPENNENSRGSALMADLGRASAGKDKSNRDAALLPSTTMAEESNAKRVDLPIEILPAGKRRRKDGQSSISSMSSISDTTKAKTAQGLIAANQVKSGNAKKPLSTKSLRKVKGLNDNAVIKDGSKHSTALKRKLKVAEALLAPQMSTLPSIHEREDQSQEAPFAAEPVEQISVAEMQHQITGGQSENRLTTSHSEPVPTLATISADPSDALMVDQGMINEFISEKGSKKRSTTSSYWTVSERNDFMHLFKMHGKDVAAIASKMKNKSEIQVRNYIQNNADKLEPEMYKMMSMPLSDGIPEELRRLSPKTNSNDGASSRNSIRNLLNDPSVVATDRSTLRHGPRTGFFQPAGAHAVVSPPLPVAGRMQSPPPMSLVSSSGPMGANSNSILNLLNDSRSLRLPPLSNARLSAHSEPPPVRAKIDGSDEEIADGSETEDEDVDAEPRPSTLATASSSGKFSEPKDDVQVMRTTRPRHNSSPPPRPTLPPPSSLLSFEGMSEEHPLLGKSSQMQFGGHQIAYPSSFDRYHSFQSSYTAGRHGSVPPNGQYIGMGHTGSEISEHLNRMQRFTPSPNAIQSNSSSSYFGPPAAQHQFSQSRLGPLTSGPGYGMHSMSDTSSSGAPSQSFAARGLYSTSYEVSNDRSYRGLQAQTSSERGSYAPSEKTKEAERGD